MASNMVTVRSAIAAALGAASLPLSPVIEAKWFTTRTKARTQGQTDIALPETSPLITVAIADRGATRVSDSNYATHGVISIGLRCNCSTDERADQLDELLESIIDAVWAAEWPDSVMPPLEQVVTSVACMHDVLNTGKVWVSELACLIGVPMKEVA